ncbi:MAG: glycosyltransferase family 2 protein [Gammaproteobacteria bacterium]|jgi:glycosyltransferase involved in cell wall biosynthesis|nr:glycosyltransferase family 2 protein [Gammaproteobacteria bacterium]
MSKLSVYIIAYNEASKVAEAIRSVAFADEIIVADSFSTDDTAKIASDLGAKVVQVPFTGFGDLRNQALKACSHEWIFSLDSDERCTADAQAEILATIHSRDPLDVYFMPRKNIFMGRWIKHVWPYPDYRQPQLFRKGKMEYKPDAVHEGFISHSDRPLGYLKCPIWQIPYRNVEEMMRKMNRYSTLGVERLIQKGVKPSLTKAISHAFWKFFQFYILKAGFLDGKAGLVIAVGHFDYTFFRYIKLLEQEG